MDNRKGTILLSLPFRSLLLLERFFISPSSKLERLLHDIFRSLNFPSLVACHLGSNIDRQKRIDFVHYARNNLTLLNLSIDFNLVERALGGTSMPRSSLPLSFQSNFRWSRALRCPPRAPSPPRRFVSFSLRARERIICLLCRLENDE